MATIEKININDNQDEAARKIFDNDTRVSGIAESAEKVAKTANTEAGEANKKAKEALLKSDSAEKMSNDAKSKADQATTIADVAKETASKAKLTADQAIQTADESIQTAEVAKEEATKAREAVKDKADKINEAGEKIVYTKNGTLPTVLDAKSISIMGDSISTFNGYNPSGHNPFYPYQTLSNVDQTWWKMLLNMNGANLQVNESWGGARISTTNSVSSSFTLASRLLALDNPDIILNFGGINDLLSGTTALGEFNTETITRDLSTFKQAYQYVIEEQKRLYSKSIIILVIPIATTRISLETKNAKGWSHDDMREAIKELANIYNVGYIDLLETGISYENGGTYLFDGLHPNSLGMKLIADYLSDKLNILLSYGNLFQYKADKINQKGESVSYANIENSSDGLFQIIDEKEIPIVEIDNKGNIRTPQTEMSNNGILEVLDEKENTIFKITKDGQIEMPLDAISGLSDYIQKIGQIIDSEDRITTAFKPNDFGSKGFRIPFCAITKKGTIIVGCEVRYAGTSADHQKIDIGIKRSYDSGKTFADSQIVHTNNNVVTNSRKTQGVICVDEITGRIYLFAHAVDNNSTWESQTQDKWYEQNCDFLYKYSDDDGDTWSEDISIQNLQPELFPVNCVSLFPATGAGITMQDGTIVIPCQCKRSTMYAGTEIDETKIFNIQSCFVYLTPENKKTQTWQVSAMVPTYTSENMIIEYEKGKLMINCRGYLPNGRRVFVTDDMGATWTAHETDKQLLEPSINGGCQGTLIKISIGDGEFKKEYGLFLNPQDVTTRLNMTIQVSADFKNWLKYKVIYAPYSFGYSCMAYRNSILIALHEQSDNNMMLYVLNSDINKIPKKIWE